MAGIFTFFRNIALFCLIAGFYTAGFCAVVSNSGITAFADDVDEKFSEAKGKFLLTALNYIELPAGSDKYNVCVVGDSLVYNSAHDFYEASKSRLKPASVKALDAGSDALSSCHVVFIGKNYPDKETVIDRINGGKRPVISISDTKNFAEGRGAMELFDNDGRLAFIINLKKAKQPGLKIDSKMIELAYKTI